MRVCRSSWWTPHILHLTIILLFSVSVRSQDTGDYHNDGAGDGGSNGGGASSSPAANSYFSQLMFSKIANLTDAFRPQIEKELRFCIKDPKAELDSAFNFSSDPTFMTNCLKQNQDLSRRICTAAEVTYYFNSFLDSVGPKSFIRPNLNCNLTSWVPGCEPGWACSVPRDKKVNLKDDKNLTVRNLNCRPCCEGFFCPEGLTCMIPCPLGSYCPSAKLNKTTGLCEPYNYQLPPGQPNHTCGGADKWADVVSSSEIFCPAGYYCPSNIQKISCSRGHYCRMGSTSQTKCYNKASCKPNSTTQNITVFGILLIVSDAGRILILSNKDNSLWNTERERVRCSSFKSLCDLTRMNELDKPLHDLEYEGEEVLPRFRSPTV